MKLRRAAAILGAVMADAASKFVLFSGVCFVASKANHLSKPHVMCIIAFYTCFPVQRESSPAAHGETMLSTMYHVLVTSCMQTLPRINGVSSHSILNSSRYSNVVDDLSSPDIMQDVLEGTLELLEAKVLESSKKMG